MVTVHLPPRAVLQAILPCTASSLLKRFRGDQLSQNLTDRFSPEVAKCWNDMGADLTFVFTARRYAKRGIRRRRVSFCLSVCRCVCVSVTLRYCIKTAKRRITQITPHDSPVTLVF